MRCQTHFQKDVDTDEDEADRADREARTSARRESEDPAGDQS